jgi:hypothetical protein
VGAVGHVDVARTPCRPEDELAIYRGHVEFALIVLRVVTDLEACVSATPEPHRHRSA